MPPPPKGKAPTKGAKQILAENAATVLFYRNMSLGSSGLYNLIFFLFFYEHMNTFTMSMNVLVTMIYLTAHQLMRLVSRPQYSVEYCQVVNPGIDLNMEGGIGEHLKDVVILTTLTQLMSLASNYCWAGLLLIPLRIVWLFWANVLGPWFFQEDPEDSDQDEKKRRKMERRMRRMQ